MGGAQWTTPQEKMFLKANVKQFEAAQAAKKTTFWISQLLLKFFDKFTDYSNGRNMTTRAQVEKRIRSWFNNHSGVRNREPDNQAVVVNKIKTGGKAPRNALGVMLVGDATATRPKQKLQPVQAYSAVNYRVGKELKTIIDAEWAAKPDNEKVTAEGDRRGPRLRYRNKRLEEFYLAEPQDVKDQIDDYRNAKAAEAPQASVLITVVANEPKRGGQFAVYQYTAGSRKSDGKDFFQAHPQSAARSLRDLKVFAKSCEDEDMLHDMKIVYPQPTHPLNPGVVDVDLAGPSAQAVAASPPDPPHPSSPPPAREESAPKKSHPGYKFKQPRKVRFHVDEDEDEDNGMDIDFDRLERFEDEVDDEIEIENELSSSMFPNPSSLSSPSLRVTNRNFINGDERLQLEGGQWVNNYEYERLNNIARNNELMKSLGIPDAVKAVVGTGRPDIETQRNHLPKTNAGPPSRVPPPRASKEGGKVYISASPDDINEPATYTFNRAGAAPGANDSEPTALVDHSSMPAGAPSSPKTPSFAVDTIQHPVTPSHEHEDEPTRVATSPTELPFVANGVPGADNCASAPLGHAFEPAAASVPSPAMNNDDGGHDSLLPIDDNHAFEPAAAPVPPPAMNNNNGGHDSLLPIDDNHETEPAAAPILGAEPTATSGLSQLNDVTIRDEADEPSSSPREKAKNARIRAKRDAAEAVIRDDSIATTPSADVSSVVTNQIDVADINVLDVPALVQDHFAYLRSSLQGSTENKLLLDWLTLECEDRGKKNTKLPVASRPKAGSAPCSIRLRPYL
ncbi:hypothetical protein SCHPADRAFT_938706 [Schizopora paradoxa]|uniref:Uncharacterized protein n=1 Tax=Schizopora paradoxa TaxID=27342 RepID=A0A0H2SEK9_9AGAM|nr:hypothetical protein SCHPADRAFT_938706 [Schizopora paradoxa]